MPRVHILHENDEWTAPLRAALERRGLAYADWHLARGSLDLSATPPLGVFYSRMSASSHTRGHRYAPEHTACVLSWLEAHGRRVVNGSPALALEISKVAQYAALGAHGIATPRTIAAVGREELIAAAGKMEGAFITKHNRAGKGLGVRLFQDSGALADYAEGPDFEPSVDGVTLVQQYIEAPQPFITRIEFVGGRFLYAVRVDTSEGFELCPADDCRSDGDLCPAGDTTVGAKFQIIDGFRHPLVRRLEDFLAVHGIEIAGVEFIVDGGGEAYVYDINTNTNYNGAAEAVAGRSGMEAIAAFLGRELSRAVVAGAGYLSAAE
jgi:hypothetical protein